MVSSDKSLPSVPDVARKIWEDLRRLLRARPALETKKHIPNADEHVVNWKDIEHFDQSWKSRISRMAAFVPPKARVLDLGCGEMWLREFLQDCAYIPVDYKMRGPGTIICDFNQGEFPDLDVDVAFVSGCLEYVEDPAWFIGKVAAHAKMCVISYCSTEHFVDPEERAALGWKNSLDSSKLISLFASSNMRLTDQAFLPDTKNTVFRFVA